jgi:hypothetical protein
MELLIKPLFDNDLAQPFPPSVSGVARGVTKLENPCISADVLRRITALLGK